MLLPVLSAHPGPARMIVAPGGVSWGRPDPNLRDPLTSAGGMPSGGRQGNTMPCSRDTSLASGSCSKFLRKSGSKARVVLQPECLTPGQPVPWSHRGHDMW